MEGVFHIAWTRRGNNVRVRGMCGLKGTSEKLGADERKVFLNRKDFCFGVEVLNGGHFETASGNAERRVLDDLESIDV